MIGILLTTMGDTWETAQGPGAVFAAEYRKLRGVQDEVLSPAVWQVACQEHRQYPRIDGPRPNDPRDDRHQAVTDTLLTEAINLPNFRGD